MKTKEKNLIIDTELTIEKIEETKDKLIYLIENNHLEKILIKSDQIDLTGIQLILALKKSLLNNNIKIKIELDKIVADRLKLYGFEILNN